MGQHHQKQMTDRHTPPQQAGALPRPGASEKFKITTTSTLDSGAGSRRNPGQDQPYHLARSLDTSWLRGRTWGPPVTDGDIAPEENLHGWLDIARQKYVLPFETQLSLTKARSSAVMASLAASRRIPESLGESCDRLGDRRARRIAEGGHVLIGRASPARQCRILPLRLATRREYRYAREHHL